MISAPIILIAVLRETTDCVKTIRDMKKNKQYTRDIDVFDGDKLVGTIYNATSYSNAIHRSSKELKLPLNQSGYEYINTFYRTGKLIGNQENP